MATAVTTAANDYRELAVEIREAGLLERRTGYYGVKIASTLAAFAAGWAALFFVNRSWAVLGVAAFLAVSFTQVLFIGHDSGHQQVFASRRANWLLGLVVGNALTGLSFGWWVPKHSAHHAHPNQVGRDPDIGSGAMGRGLGAETADRPGLASVLLRCWKVVSFVPLVFLELGMHRTSFQALVRRRDRGALAEALLLSLHAALYLTAVFWLLSPLKAIAFVAVQQVIFGVYLRLSFAPNHKGMPIIDPEARMSFVRRQVITARNVTGGRFTTFMLGGLNYQIEHHLFPTMPRPNLPRAQTIIRAFCAEHDLPYCEDSLLGSYRRAVAYLRTASASTQAASPVPATAMDLA
jgi:fatty acid desaturase